ncbi:MAG TPA: deoxyribodipyrimidine photo-lyase, partial [Amphiplicatus sp.]|nr:deoxyribodipyrimidine photo-lyase [Amphiplicatus sp.]
MASKPSIVLFRRDLRLADNPALRAGAERGAVIPLFILDDRELPKLGGAALWWLHFSLSELAGALADRGAPLVLRRGDSGAVIRSIVAETGADAVFWNRRYTSVGMAADKALKTALTEEGV